MNEINPFFIGGISFLIPTLMVLIATLYYYIDTKKFNKYGTVTYGEIIDYEYGTPMSYRYGDDYQYIPNPDYVYVKFNLKNQEHIGVIYTNLPFLKKSLEKKYAIGSKKKIKVLKKKKGNYDVRILKENKENVSYQKPIILAVITIFMLSISVSFFLNHLSYKEYITNNLNNTVNYNKALNNPYIEKFATLNDETIESMNTKFGVQGRLENPSISQASYIWEVKAGMKIRGTINSEGKVRSVEIEAQDDEFYDSNVKFADDISTLSGKTKLTYEDCKAKCGGIDGTPTRISNGKVNTYVWVNSEYKFTITIGSSGYVTSTILKPR